MMLSRYIKGVNDADESATFRFYLTPNVYL